MRTILLLGSNGQVGWELQRTLSPLGEVVALDRRQLDLADTGAIEEKMMEIRPQIIVNAAAYTAVDQAEAEPDLAMRINAAAPAALAAAAKKLASLLVHYSTDYVFDGEKKTPYVEDDTPNPRNAYGKSKLAGERAIQSCGCRHLIFRVSWIYGLRGRNFLATIERLASERDELRIVDDQIGAPTWSRMIAEASALALAADAASGIYHLSAAGATSWHGFAQAILAASGWAGRLSAIRTCDYPLPAVRPANSLLDNGKLGRELRLALPSWENGLALCLAGRPLS